MDQNTYRVFRYLNRHSGRVSYDRFRSKFLRLKNPSIVEIERWMFTNRFAYLTDHAEQNEIGELINPQTIALTIHGKQAFEKHSSKSHSDKFARITAVMALLISLASLIVAILK